jgi:hypothetical protein
MSHQSRRWPAFVALLALTAAVRAADPPDKMVAPAENKALDAKVHSTLRDVINRGAELYNSLDYAACYRLYEGSLMTIRPLIDHRPDLQKAITAGIASAERDPLVWRRAFTLRNVIDKIRTEVNPKKVAKKLTVPPTEDKEPGEKKPTEKVPVKKPTKKPVEDEPEKKEVEKKKEEKEPEKKEEKEPEKKKAEKKSDDKESDDDLPPPKEVKESDGKKSGDKNVEEKKGD